ncbi:hypothetical protein ACH5RR_022211 [Cinchona calisaya]|uniref:Uncharacterized protein n=1 Tax=Cinchona calisaya TaxID=153742 RepID=A0ABD2Z769_9GENT
MQQLSISFSCWTIILLVAAVATATDVFPEDLNDDCIIDISHPIKNFIPSVDSTINPEEIIKVHLGTITVTSTFNFSSHLGTNVAAPSYIFKNLRQTVTVDSLKVSTLIGPVLVVQTPNNSNITENVLRSLSIPREVKRVIFKTQNTDGQLMDKRDYTGFTADGAKYLVDYTDIKFVGIDYMSVARKDEIAAVHQILLDPNKGIIPVGNLKLDQVNPGFYSMNCLPLRILTAAAPVRCILVKN